MDVVAATFCVLAVSTMMNEAMEYLQQRQVLYIGWTILVSTLVSMDTSLDVLAIIENAPLLFQFFLLFVHQMFLLL